jgi:hypothetical protein
MLQYASDALLKHTLKGNARASGRILRIGTRLVSKKFRRCRERMKGSVAVAAKCEAAKATWAWRSGAYANMC